MGTVFSPFPAEGLYPAVGLHSEGEEVRLRLGAEWERKEVILMSIDSCEEDWVRLHDVRLNGQLLEYTGRGKSIIDVGLAQARAPLDTTNHYFEIEIYDPGENCYIAIGLARGVSDYCLSLFGDIYVGNIQRMWHVVITIITRTIILVPYL